MGMAPAPKIKAAGIVSETAIFLALGGPIEASAANPGGKKQTAITGWRKTRITIQVSGTLLSRIVIKPVIRSTPLMVGFGPRRSLTHPAINAINTPEIRESATKVLAQLRSNPLFSHEIEGEHGVYAQGPTDAKREKDCHYPKGGFCEKGLKRSKIGSLSKKVPSPSEKGKGYPDKYRARAQENDKPLAMKTRS